MNAKKIKSPTATRHQADEAGSTRVWFKCFAYITLLIVLAAGVIVSWQWLAAPGRFPIRVVKIMASYRHVSQQTVRDTIGDTRNIGFFSVPLSTMKQRLLKLPWIANVSINRVWPDRLNIHIVEQQAVAHWNGVALVNPKGVVFAPAITTLPKGLVQFNGPNDESVIMWDMYQQWQRLFNSQQLNIKQLSLSSRHSWTITLGTGLKVVMGSVSTDARLHRFLSIYPQLTANKKRLPKRVDLRYPNGVAVAY